MCGWFCIWNKLQKLDDALVWQMLIGAAPCIILHQTRIICWNAGTMFRAEQGPCAPNKGLCKQIQRESQRENLCGSLCCSLWLSLWLSLVLSLALCLSGALSLALSLSLYCTLHTFALCIILHCALYCWYWADADILREGYKNFPLEGYPPPHPRGLHGRDFSEKLTEIS